MVRAHVCWFCYYEKNPHGEIFKTSTFLFVGDLVKAVPIYLPCILRASLRIVKDASLIYVLFGGMLVPSLILLHLCTSCAEPVAVILVSYQYAFVVLRQY